MMGILIFDFGGSAVKYGYWNGQALEDTSQFPTPKKRTVGRNESAFKTGIPNVCKTEGD